MGIAIPMTRYPMKTSAMIGSSVATEPDSCRATGPTLDRCARRSRAIALLSPLPPIVTVPAILLLIVKLDRDFHRAGNIQRSDARIHLPDDDNAGVRNLRAIISIEDG